MQLPRIAQKNVIVTISGTLEGGGPLTAGDVQSADFALLAPNRKPLPETVWEPPASRDGLVAALVLAGEDFETPAAGAFVAPLTDADLWMLVNDGDEVDAVFIERINVT